MSEALTTEWKPKAPIAMITGAVMLATIVEVLNTSIANVALKTIAGAFSVSNDESLWIVTLFLIASSILLPATDWCSSVFGRKKFFLFCIALFGISAFLCGIAPNYQVLLFARILQGLGGGCLVPLSQAILLETWPKEEHGKAMAIFGLGIMVAPILGPIIGGWLTTNCSWNWVFFISVPLCIAAFAMVAVSIEDPPYARARGWQKLDFTGFILLVIWISTFQVMIDNGQKNGWFGSDYICKLGAISLIAFILLLWRELTCKNPLLDLKIFKNWNFAWGTAVITVTFAIAYGSIAILPMFLQSLLGYNAYLSGLAAGPMGVGSLIGVLLTGALAKTIDLRKQVALGIVAIAIGSYMFSNLNLSIALLNVILPNIVLGFGMSTVVTPATTLIYSSVLNSEMTNASSLQNLVKNVGCAVGTSSVGVLVSMYSQVHQNYLVGKMHILNPVFAERYNDMVTAFMQFGGSITTAQAKAHAMLYKQLIQQSTLSAYMSSYKVYAVVILLVLPLVFVIKRVRYDKPADDNN